MEELEKLARTLGETAKDHERCVALREASRAFQDDAEAQKLREEYDAAVTTLREKMAQGQPLEPEEKRAEAELRVKVAANPRIQALVKAQADFHELMSRINDTVQRAMDL